VAFALFGGEAGATPARNRRKGRAGKSRSRSPLASPRSPDPRVSPEGAE